MLTASPSASSRTGNPGIVYQTTCQNPGCGFSFELRITPQNAGLLGGTMACPRCHRHGGMLKPQGRLGQGVFAAKLIFRAANVAVARPEDEGDLFEEVSR